MPVLFRISGLRHAAFRSTRPNRTSNSNQSLILGLSVSTHTTGFSVVNLSNGITQKVGLIDTSSNSNNLTQLNQSVNHAQTDYNLPTDRAFQSRDTLCEALIQLRNSMTMTSSDESESESLMTSSSQSFAAIALEDVVQDKSLANCRKDLNKLVELTKLVGLLEAELKNIFQVSNSSVSHSESQGDGANSEYSDQPAFAATTFGSGLSGIQQQPETTLHPIPILSIHPARARALILRCTYTRSERRTKDKDQKPKLTNYVDSDIKNTNSNSDSDPNRASSSPHHLSRDKAREALYALARSRIPQFPQVQTKKSQKTCISSFYMSDAWATALTARLDLKTQNKYNNEKLLETIERQVRTENKKIRKLEESVKKLYPRKTAEDLREIMEETVEKEIRFVLRKMVIGENPVLGS